VLLGQSTVLRNQAVETNRCLAPVGPEHGDGSNDGVRNGRDLMGGASDTVGGNVYHSSGPDLDARRHRFNIGQFGKGEERERRSEREDI